MDRLEEMTSYFIVYKLGTRKEQDERKSRDSAIVQLHILDTKRVSRVQAAGASR